MTAAPRLDPPAVIFDLDGTLVDTLDDIRDCLNASIATIARAPLSREAVRGLIGEGINRLLARAGADDPMRLARLFEAFDRDYRVRLLNHSRLYPGISALLDGLEDAGIPKCVLSNKLQDYTATICRALLSRWNFAACQGMLDQDRRKPDPREALKLAHHMKRAPKVVYLIGDAPSDVQTAANAGMNSIAVTWGYRDQQELLAAHPTHLVNEPLEILSLITTVRGRPTIKPE